jgi:flagellar hook protein FlgE
MYGGKEQFMAIIGTMYSGISGLIANGLAMEIIGNNLANINTPAFKASRGDFSDILSSTADSGATVGRGSQLEAVSQVFTQGGLQSTESVTDMAIEGAGFFLLSSEVNDGNFYTRAGNFQINSTGYVVNPNGYFLQGYVLDADGEVTGTPSDIRIGNAPLEPKPTGHGTGIEIYSNLDANAELNPGGVAFDATDPDATSNFSASITVYDSLGESHQVTAYFRKTAENPTGNTWEWNAVTPADDHATGVDTICANGTLEFNTDGGLVTETTTASSFDFSGGATQAQAIAFDFGDAISDGGTGFSGSTQFGAQSAVSFQSQDGSGPSYLQSISIDTDGIIMGKYNNGETVQFAQISMANFNTPEKLTQVGGNVYQETTQSGPPIIGVADTAGNGRIFSNTLEMSNVDMAQQFVQMITTQRGYQANSRSISTTDEMLTELLNLKR